jgi:hypothetical protein
VTLCRIDNGIVVSAEPMTLHAVARSVVGAIAVPFVQPVHFCERDSHPARVVVFYAIKRETDKRVAYRNVSITLRHLGEKFRLQEETLRPLPAAAAGG